MIRVKIHIGDIHVSREPAVVATLLGSCVSVCLYDPVNGIGGMNHILLPGRADFGRFDGATRYGINAMELLINDLMKAGSLRCNLTAKVFGGAHIIQVVDEMNSPGQKNVEFVEHFLETERIPISGRDTGGKSPRRIYFYTKSGDVYVKKLPTILFGGKVMREERDYSDRIRNEMREKDRISLFQRP